MLRTIKKTKQMRLDELIKYIFENNIKNKYFYSEQKKALEVDMNGKIIPKAHFNKYSIFPVEIEEEITEDTEFEKCVVIFKDKTISTPVENNIKFIKEFYKNIKSVYALIDGKLELILEEKDND